MSANQSAWMTIFPRSWTQSAMAAICCCAVMTLVTSQAASAGDKAVCSTAGPQAPRDITKTAGSNSITFAKAPAASKMQLCDIHFHRNAEHRAGGYLKLAGEGKHQGYVCKGHTPKASHSHQKGKGGCEGIADGDTVEVHWVFTTCDVKPAHGLGSCFTATCKDPKLRVEARVFFLTNDKTAGDFRKFTDFKSGQITVPTSGQTVEYLGSTTGDKYNDGSCSPFKVTWSVSPTCSPLNLKSINSWCGKNKNAFEEDHAHGVRRLVTGGKLLSTIK